MSSLGIRVAAPEDAERLTELLNAISFALYGEPDLTVDELRPFLSNPRLEILVAERDGDFVGSADRRIEDERDRCWLDVRVLKDGKEVGTALLREIERRAASDADPGARAMTYVSSLDETMRGVVEAAGYRPIRASFEMAIALDDPPEPEWPNGIEVSTFEAEDEQAVHAAHQEAFRDHWEHKDISLDEWRGWFLETPTFDPTLWFVAKDEGEIAGLSLCRVHWSGDPQHGYVSVLGVRRPWRKRGLGTALLQHSFREMKRRGMTRASLGVDAESLTGAVGLYERAGMSVDRRYDCYLKEL